MSEKIAGYILLIAGVGVILLALINGYGLFTGSLTPVKFFNLQGIGFDLSQLAPLPSATGTKQELISGSDISNTTNFFLHLIILGFFLNVGSKLGSLGVQLLRPIKVEVKDNKVIQ
ncbi:hypothetical protein A2872_04155 [Candidatus Gottesmanbacteria bacterium RIFCSPHIGHO2_01_FULL_42_12]|uniref:Uncharacterized protein n=1 Tax=Candidatus Gottesmanbacteria bacterium RIFCSPHIGHO2_01_FULL_42_12 TaxID=1798377 RepID=A0A1F5Z151_9BACT|nr:MAG: hypothetical protein A2872_04155 [Candidatus Gottesmanbacteria bacterium RIFCSPHIGHO2_01_FULL_42_12]